MQRSAGNEPNRTEPSTACVTLTVIVVVIVVVVVVVVLAGTLHCTTRRPAFGCFISHNRAQWLLKGRLRPKIAIGRSMSSYRE